MKLKVEFVNLDTLGQQMGAAPSTWRLASRSLDPREKFEIELEEGIEIALKDVEPQYGGLLTYKGEQVLLYIKDTRKSEYILEHMTEDAPRFHVSECRTLGRMREAGRFERYVVTNRIDGRFLVESLDPDSGTRDELESELHVCKNCLNFLNYETYNNNSKENKRRIWGDFSLEDFFGCYATFFHNKPKHSDLTAPKGGYAPNWSEISTKMRDSKNWTCEKCRVNLNQNKGLLHCHHISGVLSDNSSANLKVLCALCHSEQPNHHTMHISSAARKVILGLRAKVAAA